MSAIPDPRRAKRRWCDCTSRISLLNLTQHGILEPLVVTRFTVSIVSSGIPCLDSTRRTSNCECVPT